MNYLNPFEYQYDGPVLLFDKIVCNRWQATTSAPSKRKARSNLIFRFKKENGLAPNAKIILPNDIVLLNVND